MCVQLHRAITHTAIYNWEGERDGKGNGMHLPIARSAHIKSKFALGGKVRVDIIKEMVWKTPGAHYIYTHYLYQLFRNNCTSLKQTTRLDI